MLIYFFYMPFRIGLGLGCVIFKDNLGESHGLIMGCTWFDFDIESS